MHRRPFDIPLAVSIAALLLAACSSSTENQEPKELVNAKQANVDAPQAELMDAGKRFYLKGLYSVSRESFESLKNSYPLGPYAEYAEIKTADSHFEMREYETAALLYENFVKDHPGSAALPYMLLMAGMSHQLSYGGLGRDPQPLEKSLQFYDRLAASYPRSPYAKSSLAMKKKVVQQLMAQQRLVIDFYRRREVPKAASARKDEYQRQWPEKLQNLEAQEAAQAAAGQPAEEGPRPVALSARRGGAARGDEAPGALAGLARNAGAEGQSLSLLGCSDDKVTLGLGARVSLEDAENLVRAQRKLSPKGGELSLRLPGAPSDAIVKDCFEAGDLTLTGNVVKLRTNRAATALTMDRPPRVVLILE